MSQFGKTLSKKMRTLKTNQISKPIVSPWGVHILRKEKMTDKDILNLIKKQYINELHTKIFKELRKTCDVKVLQ